MGNTIRERVSSNLRHPQAGFVGWVVIENSKKKLGYLERQAVRLSKISPHHKVLEVGFGPALGIHHAYQHVKDGSGIVCGVDPSEHMVGRAVKKFRRETETRKIDISIGSVYQLPYNTDLFDRIFHCNTYYYWRNMPLAVRELHRVLKPNGVMVTTLNTTFDKKQQAKGYLGNAKPDPLSYMRALENEGFSNVRIEYLEDQGREYQAIFARAGLTHSNPYS